MKKILYFLFLSLFLVTSCKKNNEEPEPDPSDNLALDSLTATKRTVVKWEEIYIKAYARGKNLKYTWSANHGSLLAKDSFNSKLSVGNKPLCGRHRKCRLCLICSPRCFQY